MADALSTHLEKHAHVPLGFDLSERVADAETLHLIRRYNDTAMSFAKACLVRMVEKSDHAVVFTTDSDFRTHRKNGRQVIPLIIPT